jgi:hypothetical protein
MEEKGRIEEDDENDKVGEASRERERRYEWEMAWEWRWKKTNP